MQLQPQLPFPLQRPEVEPVVPGGLAAADELLDLGAADGIPAGLVVVAERRRPLGPQGAERQPADPLVAVLDSRQAGHPRPLVGLARSLPKAVVAHAQALPSRPEAAPGDGAGRQFRPADRVGPGVCDERLDVRFPAPLPAVVVAPAELAGAGLARASGDPAGAQIEDHLPGGGDEHVHAELRPDGGHQFAEQPGAGGRSGRHRVAHQRTSRPVRNPAASRARRASSTDKWP